MFDFFKKKPVSVITAVQPKEPVVRQFQVLNTFTSPEFQTEYVKGQMYTLREGNTKLAECIERWIKQRRVQYIGE